MCLVALSAIGAFQLCIYKRQACIMEAQTNITKIQNSAYITSQRVTGLFQDNDYLFGTILKKNSGLTLAKGKRWAKALAGIGLISMRH
jgi:hypothetical protein